MRDLIKKVESILSSANRFISIMAAILAVFIGFKIALFPKEQRPSQSASTIDLKAQQEKTKQELIQLRNEIATVRLNVFMLKVPDHKLQTPSYRELSNRVNKIEKKLFSLENVILDNPEKALSTPLLRRDIDNLKSSYDSRIATVSDSLAASVNQLYTVIGTVTVVIGVGLLGALFAVFSSNK